MKLIKTTKKCELAEGLHDYIFDPHLFRRSGFMELFIQWHPRFAIEVEYWG